MWYESPGTQTIAHAAVGLSLETVGFATNLSASASARNLLDLNALVRTPYVASDSSTLVQGVLLCL